MFPKLQEIELPLLEEIHKRGGVAKRGDKQLHQDVAKHFPQLTQADLAQTLKSGQNKWENLVSWATIDLTKRGELQKPERAVWEITQKGFQRLGQSPLDTEKKSLINSVPGHDELIKMGREMGEKLGKKVDTEIGPLYRHDISWKDNQWKNPCLVMEICDKGVLDKDIQSLNWAYQNWSCKCILITVDDKDYENALKKLALVHPYILSKLWIFRNYILLSLL